MPQSVLHSVVEALYRGSILLAPDTVEATLRAADFLQRPAVSAACLDFVHNKASLRLRSNSNRKVTGCDD